MAEESADRWALTPLRIADIYLLVGGIWILLSDRPRSRRQTVYPQGTNG